MRSEPSAPSSRRLRLEVVSALVAGAAAVAYFAAGMPGIEDVPGWFYRPQDKGIGGLSYVLAAGALLPWVAVAAIRLARQGQRVWALSLLTLFAFAIQLAFTLVPGEGLMEVWRRHEQGHGQFFAVARQQAEAPDQTLTRYEALVREGRLGTFAPSKPPGALAVYMAIDAVAHAEPVRGWLSPLAREAASNPRLRPYAASVALSFLLLPLLTALIVPAAAFLSRQLFEDARVGIGAALVVFTAPAVLLISYHLDGAVYPLIAVLGCGVLAHAARGDRHWEAVLAGALLALGVWVSFSLIPAVGLAIGCLLAVATSNRRSVGASRAYQSAGFHLAAALAGGLAVLFVLRVVWGFEITVRYEGAIEHHERWKGAVPTGLWRALSLLEFGLYLGAPLLVVWLHRAGHALADLSARRADLPHSAAAFVLALTVAMAALAGTNEVARLWLFLVPFVAIVVVASVGRSAADERDWGRRIGWLCGAQAVVALVMKGAQPW